MDPNAALSRIRALVADIEDPSVPFEDGVSVGETAIELAEAIAGLDDWLAKGGFLPTAWAVGQRGRDERTLYRWTVADADAVIGREITDDEIDRIEKAMDNSSAGESFETVVSMICDSE